MVSIIDVTSLRTKNDSGRRPKKTSDRRPANGIRAERPGENFRERRFAGVLFRERRHHDGDKEVFKITAGKSGLPAAGNSRQTLTSLPGLEEDMAKAILSALCLHFIHRLCRLIVEGR
jgi:hypothetical protein